MKYLLGVLVMIVVLEGAALSRSAILGQYFASAFVVDIYRNLEITTKGKTTTKPTPICKGALVGEDRVVTVASCVKDSKRVYQAPLRNLLIKHGEKFYPINSINVHNDYNAATRSHNIALLRLKTPIKLSKYPRFGSSVSIKTLIQRKSNLHIIYEDEYAAILHIINPVALKICQEVASMRFDVTLFCAKTPQPIRLCPSYQGTPITRVNDKKQIEIVGLVPKSSLGQCANISYVVSAHLGQMKRFFDEVLSGSYASQGALSQGYITSLPKGWHLLGSEELIDDDLAYIFDSVSKIYYFDGLSETYRGWIRQGKAFDKPLAIPSRSGFWVRR